MIISSNDHNRIFEFIVNTTTFHNCFYGCSQNSSGESKTHVVSVSAQIAIYSKYLIDVNSIR
jgi:hypothetical protein